MEPVILSKKLHARGGEWRCYDTIRAGGAQSREIYRSAQEPSFVCWPILWKEQDGALKLSFIEVVGDVAQWPPMYNFNRPGMTYELKTFVSRDGGDTWTDTGWRERPDELWDLNSDHHIRHVNVLPDGRLIRNSCRAVEGFTVADGRYLYNEKKAWEEFPFAKGPATQVYKKRSTIWTSGNGGQTWEQIYAFPPEAAYFISGFHVLKDGRIVAVGAINPEDVNAFDQNWIAITESADGGKTWAPLQKLLSNDDHIISQGMCEEFDFVELDDGRLCMLMRADGMGMHTLLCYLERDASGTWTASRPRTHPLFARSGYPYMKRAIDGTIFYYAHQNIRFSCDDGATWEALELGSSYYGQMVEAAPGRMVAVSQRNIGDASFPYAQDAYMVQTSFDYARTGVVEQTEPQLKHALAVIGDGEYEDFHLYVEIRADGETGIAFQLQENSHYFAAIAIPCNEFRAPGAAGGQPQSASLVVGKYDGGEIAIVRSQVIGKIKPGSWIAVQLDARDGVLKAAVKATKQSAARYMIIADDFARPGKIGLMTNYSTGAFKNMKIGNTSTDIRTNWGDFDDRPDSFSGRTMKEHEY